MKNLVNVFVSYFKDNEGFRQSLADYDRFLKSKNGKFFNDMIQTMIGIMANDVFSQKHTKLDAHEKDITQRTYHNLHQVLTFLSQPRKFVETKTVWQRAGVPSFKDRRKSKSKKKGE